MIMNPLLEAHRIEFNAEREPTEEELVKIHELKQTARRRIWTWTMGSFAGATALLMYSVNRMRTKAKVIASA